MRFISRRSKLEGPSRAAKFAAVGVLVLWSTMGPANAGSFIFAGEAFGLDVVAHPTGYAGSSGVVTVTVGIDPTSANSAAMVTPTTNVIAIWNALVVTTGNFDFVTISGADIDFESTLLHEMGHSIGIGHCNLGTGKSIDSNYTNSEDGTDNVYTSGAGTDTIIGSADDSRGDDTNICYFRTSTNNPAATVAGPYDSTTYTRALGSLPGGHTYAANSERLVNAALGVASTEAVMNQGTFSGETQRTLAQDDVATLSYAMSGVNETAGTGSDDYTVVLSYSGLTASADIVIDFDDAETGFAVSKSMGSFLNATHIAITTNSIFFNTGFSWHFNSVAIPVELSTFEVSRLKLK